MVKVWVSYVENPTKFFVRTEENNKLLVRIGIDMAEKIKENPITPLSVGEGNFFA